MRLFIPIAAIILLIIHSPLMQAAAQQSALQHRLADGLQRKLDNMSRNAKLARPDKTPTVISEEEINDYFAAGQVRLPPGVKKVKFEAQPGVVTGFATIDFDEIRNAPTPSNFLLSIFSGTHEVRIEADGAASGGEARVHVRKVSMDGVDVPPTALQLFLGAFITPIYPNIGIDSTFDFSERIDLVTVGYHNLTITQK
jgi:hypothetical protein